MAGSRLVLAIGAGSAFLFSVALLIAGIVAENARLFLIGSVVVVVLGAAGGGLVLIYLRRIAGRLSGLDTELRRAREQVDRIRRRVDGQAKERRDEQRVSRHDSIRDAAALLALHDLLPTPAEHVPLTGYSALPATVLHLVQQVAELPAGSTIVELGSGASTVWMALAAMQRDDGISIVSLDHDAEFARVTRRSLARNGVADLVDLRVADLVPMSTAQGEQLWYSPETWQSLSNVGLVFVDGPPGATGPMARYPALEALSSTLAPGALIVLDDTERPDERAIVEAWLAMDLPRGAAEIVELRERTTIIRVP